MDKQKQIEEMAKVVRKYYSGFSEYKVAEEIYNILIPENAVVLTREEYESVKDNVDLLREYESVSNSLIKSNELCRKLVEDKKELKRQLKQTRKETAEKFAKKILALFPCIFPKPTNASLS